LITFIWNYKLKVIQRCKNKDFQSKSELSSKKHSSFVIKTVTAK
jgi:hypothetical protein